MKRYWWLIVVLIIALLFVFRSHCRLCQIGA